MFTLIGHSMGEGFAGSSPMLAAAPWLNDKWAGVGYPTTNTIMTPTIQESVYKGIYAWTAKSGWGGSSGTPPTFGPGEGTFLPLNIIAPTSPTGVHPFPSPYNYPNTRSMPASPTVYTAATTGGRSWVGVELPLAIRLAHFWLESVYIQKLCLPGSAFLRNDVGFTLFGGDIFGVPFSPLSGDYPGGVHAHYAWYTPSDRFDWNPGSDRLYSTWKARMTAAAAEAEAAGDELDVRLIVMWMGDNDAAATLGSYTGDLATSKVKNFSDYYKNFIATIRADLVANNWTSMPAHQVRVVGMGIFRTYGVTVIRDGMNAVIQALETDDDYFRYISTSGYETLASAGYTDAAIGTTSHISHLAYLQAADAIYDKFIEMELVGEDPLANDQRISVGDVLDRISTYYERNRVVTDAEHTALLQHANAAMFHVINRVGDMAWWLRRRHNIALTGGVVSASSLPRTVTRVMRVENSNAPGYPLHFNLIGSAEQGRLQILLKDCLSGTYVVEFLTQPKDLTKDDELVPLPYNLIEWMVVEGAKRLARSSGNVEMLQSLVIEAQELQADAMRNISAFRNAADDRLYGQRKLPGRRAYRRRNAGPGQWFWG
jgi:hypothetical protein